MSYPAVVFNVAAVAQWLAGHTGMVKNGTGWVSSLAGDSKFLFAVLPGRGAQLTRIEKWSSLIALALFAVIAAMAAWRLRLRMFTQYQIMLLLVFLSASAGPIVVDFIQHTYLVAKPRYAIAALPAAYLVAAVALGWLHSRAADGDSCSHCMRLDSKHREYLPIADRLVADAKNRPRCQ